MPQKPGEMKKQSALSWYYWRLRSMHIAELPHRVIEALLRRLSRSAWLADRDATVPEAVLQKSLPAIPLNLSPLSDAFASDERTLLEEEATDLCANNIRLLHQDWPAGRSMEWSLDPESGTHWPWHQYTHDIPRRVGQGPGDVKFVWELSRLQHLQVLAFAAHVLQHQESRLSCLSQLEQWLDDNPPYLGLGYACGIELASRVISILVVVTYLGADTFSNALTVKIWKALCAHGRFIARFPSLYSSANNHLVAESAALFVLGSVAPEIPEAEKWRQLGWKRLVTEADRQILRDGAGAEQSSSYLGTTLEWLLLSRTVCASANNVECTDLDAALIRGATFISSIADIDGNVPVFGDRDDSMVLRPRLEEENHLSSMVASIASCLDRPDVQHPAFTPDYRTHMLTATSAPRGMHELSSKTFADGGYSVIRTSHHAREAFLLFDHGPLGFASTAAHGHADALSIWLHIDGKPVLVDFGTYRYAADRGWRAWARSTAAHNTIEINGVSQSEVSGPFNWRSRAEARLLEEDRNDHLTGCTAEHTGYAGRFGVVHRRSVSISKGRHIEICDSLTGKGRHEVRASFHFAPDLEVVLADDDGAFLINREGVRVATLKLDCAGLSARVIRQQGQLQPGAGAISRGYNDLVPGFSVVVEGSTESPRDMKSFIDIAEN